MDLYTPEGRFAATQALGHDGYNAAMKAHIDAGVVATVNGYRLRWVSSLFGRQCQELDADGVAFQTLEQATAHANSLPTFRAPPDRSYSTLHLSEREESFLIAAIRLWQALDRKSLSLLDATGKPYPLENYDDIASNAYAFEPLTATEVDDMCVEVLSLDPYLRDDERS